MFDTNTDEQLVYKAVLDRMSAADFYSACKHRWEISSAVRARFPTAEHYATHLVAQLLDVQRRAEAVAAADERRRARTS